MLSLGERISCFLCMLSRPFAQNPSFTPISKQIRPKISALFRLHTDLQKNGYNRPKRLLSDKNIAVKLCLSALKSEG